MKEPETGHFGNHVGPGPLTNAGPGGGTGEYREGGPVVRGHGGYSSPYSGRTDLSEQEAKALADRFKDAAVATPGTWLPIEHEIIAAPTAWQSVPKPVRFALWLWAIAVILGFAAAVFWLGVLVVGGGLALAQL